MTWYTDPELAELAPVTKGGPPGAWGPWTYRAQSRVLDYRNRYPIPLDDLTDSAKVLDIVVQVAGKDWGTPEVAGWLVIALNELLDPQGRVCGFGRNRRFNPRAHLLKARRRARSVPEGAPVDAA